jgi:hypothetical protein
MDGIVRIRYKKASDFIATQLSLSKTFLDVK